METEVAACPEWTRDGETTTVGAATVMQGRGAFVCQSGIGRDRAIEAADAVLTQFTPTAVLSVGICGGLAPGVAVGDVVVCTHVDHEEHRESDVERSVYSNETLLDAALKIQDPAGLVVRSGTSLTVDEAAWGPAEKAAHHAWKAHDIVEMESFWVAEAASKRGFPFLAVRSVSDSAGDTLPNLAVMRPDGTLDREKFLAHIKEHPETATMLSQVAQNARTGLTNLAVYLEVLLPALVALPMTAEL